MQTSVLARVFEGNRIDRLCVYTYVHEECIKPAYSEIITTVALPLRCWEPCSFSVLETGCIPWCLLHPEEAENPTVTQSMPDVSAIPIWHANMEDSWELLVHCQQWKPVKAGSDVRRNDQQSKSTSWQNWRPSKKKANQAPSAMPFSCLGCYQKVPHTFGVGLANQIRQLGEFLSWGSLLR